LTSTGTGAAAVGVGKGGWLGVGSGLVEVGAAATGIEMAITVGVRVGKRVRMTTRLMVDEEAAPLKLQASAARTETTMTNEGQYRCCRGTLS
jgi:hypothetical protein